MTHKYDDIIEMEHHVSKVHPHMSALDRAAQFAPFAALTGYEQVIEQTKGVSEKSVDSNISYEQYYEDPEY